MPACSDGGDEDRPIGDVQLAKNHHLVGIVGRFALSAFPIPMADVAPLVGTFDLTADEQYSIQAAGVSIRDEYALAADGELTVFVRRANASTLLYFGGYGLEGDTGNFFFTDRVTNDVGLYLGLPRIDGAPDLPAMAGNWHMVSMHVVFAPPSTLPSVHEVGRAFAGAGVIAADGSVDFNGSESVSPAASLPVRGSLAAFQDGVMRINVSYGSDLRSFEGGGNADLVFAASVDETGQRIAGLSAWMRQRATPVDFATLAGTFDIGAWFLRVNPSSPAFDAAFGSLEITAFGDFLIEARNNFGDELTYEGNLTGTASGALSFATETPRETWLGAVSGDDETIVFVDRNATTAVGETSGALRLFVATRRKTN